MVRKICILVLSLLFISHFHENILRGYADLFVVDTAQEGADAIIILSGNSETRVAHAVELFESGYSKKILLTDAKPQQLKYRFVQSEKDIAKLILDSENIDYSIVKSQRVGGATSTLDEAYDLANFLEKSKFTRVIIVTDSYHTRRSLYTFQKVLTSKDIRTEIQISPAFTNKYKVYSWWESEQGLLDFIPEFFKMIIYVFSLWNI